MKIFEFAFNPKKKKDRFFHVFSYEPSKDAEKPKGGLYVIGELDHALEFNKGFLKKLAQVLRSSYYGSSLKTPGPALKAALKEANAFLEKENKNGNVDWLGNLHVAILIFVTKGEKQTVFHLAKTGTINISLVRDEAVVDVGKSAEGTDQPGIVFGSVISGKLAPDDNVLVQSREVHAALSKEQNMGGVGTLRENKEFKDFFARRSRFLSQTSGILLSFIMEEETPNLASTQRPLFPRVALPKPKLLLERGVSMGIPSVSLPSIKVPKALLDLPWLRHPSAFKKRGALVLVFALLLFLGFVMFQGERSQGLQEAEAAARQIEELRLQAEDALIFDNTELADELLREAWNIAAEQAAKGGALKETFTALQQDVEERLAPLNRVMVVEDPELLFEVSSADTDVIPQKLLLAGSALYVTNQLSKELVSFDLQNNQKRRRTAAENLEFAAAIEGSPVFFASPNFFLSFIGEGIWQQTAVEVPVGFTPTAMASFNNSVYMVDGEQGAIIRYANPLSSEAGSTAWLSPESEELPLGVKSLAIDGSIWTLSGQARVNRYFQGTFRETLELSVFPPLNAAAVLKTQGDLPALYFLDAAGKRVVATDKEGRVEKQYRLVGLSNILDIAVSPDGSTIYVLTHDSVYRIVAE